MSTPENAAYPQTIVEPKNWLETLLPIIFSPVKFGWDVVEGISDSLSLVGHGIQLVEAAIINAVGSILERAVEVAAPAVDALLEQAGTWSNPLTDMIGDSVAEAAVFLLDLCGVELPSFSGLGCYGM